MLQPLTTCYIFTKAQWDARCGACGIWHALFFVGKWEEHSVTAGRQAGRQTSSVPRSGHADEALMIGTSCNLLKIPFSLRAIVQVSDGLQTAPHAETSHAGELQVVATEHLEFDTFFGHGQFWPFPLQASNRLYLGAGAHLTCRALLFALTDGYSGRPKGWGQLPRCMHKFSVQAWAGHQARG